MKLSECLNSSDIDTLRKIAETHNFDCHRSSKNSLMQSILYHFNNRKFVHEKFSTVTDDHYRETLIQLTIDKRTTFSREDLLAIAIRSSQAQPELGRQAVNRLLEDGWVYRLGGQTGRRAYYIPEDLQKTLTEYVSEHLKSQVEKVTTAPIIYRDDQLAIVRDMIQFLSYVKNNDLKLTVDGVIFKRQLAQLLDNLEIKETPLERVGWRFGYGRRYDDYPDRFALIYDYCYNRELIVEQPSGELAVTAKLDDWISRTDKEKLRDLVKFWRLLYRRPIPRINLAVNTIARVTQSAWIFAESISQLIAPYIRDFYYDDRQSIIEKRLYPMLINLGLLSIGKLADQRSVMRLTELGTEFLLGKQADDTMDEFIREKILPILIQPNFDILLPAESVGKIGWQLNQFADLVRPDAMRVYRLTKNSVLRGIAAGWTAETIIQFLDQHSEHSVPSNVKRMIEQWQ